MLFYELGVNSTINNYERQKSMIKKAPNLSFEFVITWVYCRLNAS
jgi:hypothetical protein